MSVSVEAHTETTFTVSFNDTDHILTTVTSAAADVADWIAGVLRIHRQRLRRLDHFAVGLDAEWRPNTGPQQNPVAVLQLCVGRRCLVSQIKHADHVPAALADFLSDTRFTFYGVKIKEDADKIDRDYGLTVRNAVDLRDLAAERMGRAELRRAGLATLAMEVMGVRVEKAEWISRGMWDVIYLTYDQIGYACIDAFISFEIGRCLWSWPLQGSRVSLPVDKMHCPLSRNISYRCLKKICWFVLWLVACDAGLVGLFAAWFIDSLVYLISCWLVCLRLIGLITCWLSDLVVDLVSQ